MKSKIVFHDQKIEISLKTGFVARYYDELMYVVYKELHCTFHFIDDEKYTVEVILKEMEDNLPVAAFVKCNRNTIINLCHCKGYDKTISEIRIDDGKVFTISRRNKTDFKSKRKNLHRKSTAYKGKTIPLEKFLSFVPQK